MKITFKHFATPEERVKAFKEMIQGKDKWEEQMQAIISQRQITTA